MALGIYAGTTIANMSALPSPISLRSSSELIWSENTGRAQSGENKAKMIGDVVAEKETYEIQWGVISTAEMQQIKNKLPAGFFYFGFGTSLAAAKNAAIKAYRSTIQREAIEAGSEYYYKNVSVSIIEQ